MKTNLKVTVKARRPASIRHVGRRFGAVVGSAAAAAAAVIALGSGASAHNPDSEDSGGVDHAPTSTTLFTSYQPPTHGPEDPGNIGYIG